VKICHISDLHWRSLARHEEYTESFERLYETLKRRIKPDMIFNLGDTYHSKSQAISPEVIERIAWMIKNLADICPTITILGNHDLNLTNLSRQNLITPIHESINHPDAYLYKQSGTYTLPSNVKDASKFALHVYSCADEHGWNKIKPIANKINLALFHGSITGAKTDLDYSLGAGEKDTSFFKGHQFAMLGDIHKSQALGWREVEEVVDETTLSRYKELYGDDNVEIVEEYDE